MPVAVVDRYLRRFVVRIEAEGRLRGSGVLIAPGWVATCAHVVAGHDDVEVVPDSTVEPAPPSPLVGHVRERSGPPPEGSVFWQFPDVAFIELAGWVDHPVAPLAEVDPASGSGVHAWGFAHREEGVDPVGSPAAYQLVGEDGDGYWQVQAGEAQPGLSGAPTVCGETGLVFGLVSVSRDPSQPRGGWISPLRRLDAGDGPTPLIERGRALADANDAAAWRSRSLWSSTVGGRDARSSVEQPWRHVRFEVGMASSLVLRSDYLVVDYVDRHDRLAEAISWCEQRAPVAIARVDGVGGAGKTRFGMELCRAMGDRDRAWVAGLLSRQDGRLTEVRRPRLVVVDYFDERDAQELAKELGALARSASSMFPVRIVLLARPNVLLPMWESAKALRNESTGALAWALELATDQSRAAGPLSLDERQALFVGGFVAFRRSLFPGDTTGEPPGIDLAADRYGAPFDVLLEAYDAAHGQTSTPGRPALERALDHEVRHWRTREPDLDPGVLKTAVALATLATAPTEAEASVLVDLVCGDLHARRASVDRFVASLYPGPGHWNALAPDRLGEALIVAVLGSHADAGDRPDRRRHRARRPRDGSRSRSCRGRDASLARQHASRDAWRTQCIV